MTATNMCSNFVGFRCIPPYTLRNVLFQLCSQILWIIFACNTLKLSLLLEIPAYSYSLCSNQYACTKSVENFVNLLYTVSCCNKLGKVTLQVVGMPPAWSECLCMMLYATHNRMRKNGINV